MQRADRLTSAHGFATGEARPGADKGHATEHGDYLVVIDGVRVRHGRVSAAGKRRCRGRRARSRSATWTSTLRRRCSLTSCCGAAGLSEDERHPVPHGGLARVGGDWRSPGVTRAVATAAGPTTSCRVRRLPPWATRVRTATFSRAARGRAVPPLRERAPAQTERRDRWKCARDGMRALSSPGPAGPRCSRRQRA